MLDEPFFLKANEKVEEKEVESIRKQAKEEEKRKKEEEKKRQK
jgi:hypothetical protein